MWTPTDTLNFLSPHLATKAQVENSRKSIPITGCGVYLKKKKKKKITTHLHSPLGSNLHLQKDLALNKSSTQRSE